MCILFYTHNLIKTLSKLTQTALFKTLCKQSTHPPTHLGDVSTEEAACVCPTGWYPMCRLETPKVLERGVVLSTRVSERETSPRELMLFLRVTKCNCRIC